MIDTSKEKLLHSILYFANNTKYLGATKLAKLLYYLDFLHYKETGKSVTGQQYFAWNFGPVPVDVYKEITGEEDYALGLQGLISTQLYGKFRKVKTSNEITFDKDIFSKRELRLLKEISTIFKKARAKEIVKVAHLKNHPWDITRQEKGENKLIDYNLVFRGLEEEEHVQAIREQQKERNEMAELFG